MCSRVRKLTAALGPSLIAHNVYYVKLWKAAKKAGTRLEVRKIIYTTNAIESLNASIHQADLDGAAWLPPKILGRICQPFGSLLPTASCHQCHLPISYCHGLSICQ
jgi:hypothetical protein